MNERDRPSSKFVGEVIVSDEALCVRDLYQDDAQPEPLAKSDDHTALGALTGGIVLVQRSAAGPVVDERLAQPGSALEALYRIAAEHRLNPVFPTAVDAEVERILANPQIDDPTLTDLTELPFVTIDGPGTRDLDQALHVARLADGYLVRYALADPSWCVRPTTALFDEALRRGASYYLPGFAIPMLPRPLSEGVISLNERVDRRALVFAMEVDRTGRCVETTLARARVRSRAQLTFDGVQSFLDDPSSTSLPDGVGASLELLREVGRKRIADAKRRDVVRYRRHETEVTLSGIKGLRFAVVGGMRSEVERYNEQLSLMCNVQGARFLKRGDRPDDEVQPIYRVHPSPEPRRYHDLERVIEALCKHHRLEHRRWHWQRTDGQSLADYLDGLPTDGALGRIAKAIHRQAVMVNVRSAYSDEPGIHHGVGAEVYARFSAPMREIVGVFLHKEALEKLTGETRPRPATGPDDDELSGQIVERANEAKMLQKRLTKAANGLVLDQLFEDDLRLPADARPVRRGTVMGLTRSKAHVLLDDPGVEVKVYNAHQTDDSRDRIELSRDSVLLRHSDGSTLCGLGDEVQLRLRDRDRRGNRWVLSIEPMA